MIFYIDTIQKKKKKSTNIAPQYKKIEPKSDFFLVLKQIIHKSIRILKELFVNFFF